MYKENFATQPFIPCDVALLVMRDELSLFKAWRIRLGMSIEQIAVAANMLAEEVARMEAGANGMSLQLLNVARAMNLDADQLADI